MQNINQFFEHQIYSKRFFHSGIIFHLTLTLLLIIFSFIVEPTPDKVIKINSLKIGSTILFIVTVIGYINRKKNSLHNIIATSTSFSLSYFHFDTEKLIELNWSDVKITEKNTIEIRPQSYLCITANSKKIKFYPSSYQEFGNEKMHTLIQDLLKLKKASLLSKQGSV